MQPFVWHAERDGGWYTAAEAAVTALYALSPAPHAMGAALVQQAARQALPSGASLHLFGVHDGNSLTLRLPCLCAVGDCAYTSSGLSDMSELGAATRTPLADLP